MAWAAREKSGQLLCPMIDARRMEVFTAVYDQQLHEVMAPVNLILDENSFREVLMKNEICFFGNGSNKFSQLIKRPHASFADVNMTAAHMVSLSYEQFSAGDFTDIAYAEPFYGKDFYSTFK
jgi:tRNA threonylcarbamoyladenosine biosynthesis protein TsaB